MHIQLCRLFLNARSVLPLVCLISLASPGYAASALEIDTRVDATLQRFYAALPEAKTLGSRASAILIFPSVIKAGIGIGGEYGEGALRVGNQTVDYYSTAAASIGLQFGAQSKSVILMFMSSDALKQFRASDGWKVGVDGSVALVKIGTGGAIDTDNIKEPLIGFIYGQKGLMYNLTLEGSKLTKLVR